jgi:hypothetical protein
MKSGISGGSDNAKLNQKERESEVTKLKYHRQTKGQIQKSGKIS